MRKIAIANRKGGVGKTTTAVNLAHGLAMRGDRVLLVDTDQQGHCSLLLGVNPEYGLAELADGTIKPPGALIEAREGLFLLGGGKNLIRTEKDISQRMSRVEYTLTDLLKPFDGQYDYAIVDTAPGMSYLSTNALFYADLVLVPVSMEVLALDGALRFQDELKHLVGGKPFMVVPTFVDNRVSRTEKILDSLLNLFENKMLPPVRYSTRLAESPGAGLTIFEYAAKTAVAADYKQLAGVLA